VIQIAALRKTFRRTVVLDGLDLEFARGDRVALVGSNGAGKTTLIRCLLGEYVHEGTITVNGLAPRSNRFETLRRIGFVPQLPPPLRMSVNHVVSFAAEVCDTDPDAMRAVAECLGLSMSTVGRRPFMKLSGGEKQKLLIGIALGRDCDVLVLDEPTANLDPDARQTLFRLLAERQHDATMLISSHRLDEVAGLVNRVVELDQGQVVLDDRVDHRIDLASTLRTTITLTRPEPAFAATIEEWGFTGDDAGVVWRGRVAGPDRLRFLGVLSRYAALLGGLEMVDSTGSPVAPPAASSGIEPGKG